MTNPPPADPAGVRWQQASLLEGSPDVAPEPAEPAQADPPQAEPARSDPAAERLPRRLLILDTETTDLDPDRGTCIEVGAILFDLAHRSVLCQLSFLLPCRSNPAEPINGIAAEVTRLPQPWQACLTCFAALVDGCDLVVAHNAAFDRSWFGRGLLPSIPRPWLCTMEDVAWPAERRLRARPSVRDLALAYGVPVWAAHRALTDCIYLAQVFERCDDLEQLIREGLEPRRLYRALVSYEDRHRAREAGFRWNEAVPRAWSRRLSERRARALDFPVEPVHDPSEGMSGRGGLALSARA